MNCTTRTLACLLTAAAFLTALVAAPASAQNLFNNGDFSSGFTGWTQRNTSNGVGSPGSIATFQTDPNQPASACARYTVGQQVYRIGIREGVEIVQSPSLVTGLTYEIAFDWAAQADPQYINGEGGIFEILVDGQSIAYDAAGIMGAGTLVRRSLTVQFTAQHTGTHEVGARISRPFILDLHAPHQYVDNFSMTRVGGSPPFNMVRSGNCPGQVRFDITGATPGGIVGLVTSPSAGLFTIPQNMTCAGTQLNLSPNGIRLLVTRAADSNGNLVLVGFAGGQSCGYVYQAIDTATCRVSP